MMQKWRTSRKKKDRRVKCLFNCIRVARSSIISHNVLIGGNTYVGEWTKLDGNITIGENVIIGDNVTISGTITIGHNTVIGNNAQIIGNVTIGDDCIISACYIGGPAEHTHEKQDILHPNGRIEIGDNCIIREYVTIHNPTKELTKIGNHCFLMVHSHIGHDAILEDGVIVSPGGKVGGFARVMYNAYIGMGSALHQQTTVGAYAMTGMSAVVVKDVPPFYTVAGNPAKFLEINAVGMNRHGFSQEEIEAVKTFSFEALTSKYSHLKSECERFDLLRNRIRRVITRSG